MELSPNIESAIEQAAQRCCIGTVPPDVLAATIHSAAASAIARGEPEEKIIREIQAVKP